MSAPGLRESAQRESGLRESALRELVAAELDRPPGAAARAMAERLAARPGVAAVLFYGARLRDGAGEVAGEGAGERAGERAAEGPLDIYLLTDGDRAYHGWGLAALANRLMPPNVYREAAGGPPPVEAKVAVMTLRAFRARMRPGALDTTLWARFAQPAILVRARSEAERAAVIEAVAAAVETAAWWAARLAEDPADPEGAWAALFRHTYGSELRVEGGARAGGIVAAAPERYRRLHALLIGDEALGDRAAARRAAAHRATAHRAWARRRAAGKALNAARLVKAAFTYRGGIAYALAKVERHSGRPIELRPWERRWPRLAAPFVVWRLWRQGRLR